jgi:hypothetical protein
MDVIVFSDNPDISSCFINLEKTSGYTISYLPYKELAKDVKALKKNVFIYIDVSGLKEDKKDKVLQFFKNYTKRAYGIIDSTGRIKDIGALFLDGASDYIGKDALYEEMSPLRLKKAYKLHLYKSHKVKDIRAVHESSEFIISPTDWSIVKTGKEYTFYLMYIQLENSSRLTKNFGDSQIKAADNSFKAYIDRKIAHSGGKIWMWNNFEGLILFPFTGRKCNAILTCFGLMLSQKIYSVENRHFHSMLSIRIAIHIGNTIYRKKGDTGTIVSDSINTTFNLGRKFGDPGNFYLTKQVLEFAHEGLKGCFIPAGHYNGIKIMRMRHLV